MQRGETVVAGTLYHAVDPWVYCAMANAGYDFIWVEMQHSTREWQDVERMWRTCPHAKAVPGVRVAYADEREIQHALDAGALVIIVPTVDTVAEATQARDWTFFPPLGRRSNANTVPARDPDMWGSVPGGYRNTINDNVVLIEMIETLDGLKDADKIAKVPGITAIFAAGNDLGNFGGFNTDAPDYEREINIVHDAAIKAGVRLCGPLAWRGRPDFTCFQAGSEAEAITRGAAMELGSLAEHAGRARGRAPSQLTRVGRVGAVEVALKVGDRRQRFRGQGTFDGVEGGVEVLERARADEDRVDARLRRDSRRGRGRRGRERPSRAATPAKASAKANMRPER